MQKELPIRFEAPSEPCPPSVAEGDSFPQIAQTSAEVWESSDADAIQRGNQFPLWDPLRSPRGREVGTPLVGAVRQRLLCVKGGGTRIARDGGIAN